MRALQLTIFVLSLFVGLAPASALQAHDTMRAWKAASERERTDFLKHLPGKPLDEIQLSSISKCLGEASHIPGHAELEIAEIVKACMAPGNMGQPV